MAHLIHQGFGDRHDVGGANTGSSRPNNSRLSRSQSPRSGARKGTYRLLARQLGLSKYRLEIVKRSRFEFDGPIKVEKPLLRRHTSGQRLAPIPAVRDVDFGPADLGVCQVEITDRRRPG